MRLTRAVASSTFVPTVVHAPAARRNRRSRNTNVVMLLLSLDFDDWQALSARCSAVSLYGEEDDGADDCAGRCSAGQDTNSVDRV